MAASDEATPSPSDNNTACSLKHMGGGGGGADETNIAANEEQQVDVQQTATSTTQYDVEHLATFSTSTTSSHEMVSGALGGTKNETTKATNASDESTTTTSTNSRVAIGAAGEPRVALERLFELEKLSGIWTQRMQIELQSNGLMLILDCETNSIVERFSRARVTKPQSFNQYNDIYNNIIVFLIEPEGEEEQLADGDTTKHSSSLATSQQRFRKQQAEHSDDDEEKQNCAGGELHIFQCVSHQAQQLVDDILAWKSSASCETPTTNSTCKVEESSQESVKLQIATSKKFEDNHDAVQTLSQPPESSATTMASKPLVAVVASGGGAPNGGDNVPIVNVNVKETVQVFNQIAALREKG